MKVAINAMAPQRRGNLTYTTNVISYLSEYRNHRFHIWVRDSSGHIDGENIIVHRIPSRKFSPFRRLLYDQMIFRKQVFKMRADILFSSANYGLFSKKIFQVLLIQGPPAIYNSLSLGLLWPRYSIFQKIEKVVRRILMKFSAMYSQVIVFPSYAMKNDFLRYYPMFRSKCLVNYYGIRAEEYRSIQRKRARPNEIRLLYVSGYSPHKNPGVIVDAIKYIKSEGIDVSARITMDMESNLARRLVTWQEDYDKLNHSAIRNHVELGSVPHAEVAGLYGNADIFVFPSVVESFGFPMIEAMAAGLPIVVADTRINREICGNAALYFPPLDGKDLGEKIILLHNNEENMNNLILEAGHRIHRYNWEDHVDKLVTIFEKNEIQW